MSVNYDDLLNAIIEKEIELIDTGESSLTPEEYKALLIKEYKLLLTQPREVKEQGIILVDREMKKLTDDEGNVVYNTKTGLPIEIPTGNLVEQFPLTVIQQVRGLGEYYLHDVEGNDDKLTITWGCGDTKEITINNVANATTAQKLGTATVGSGVNHIYLNSGSPTASTSTVGGTARPMYLNSGTMTACSASVGSSTTPVYMDNGTLKACDGSIGGDGASICVAVYTGTSGSGANQTWYYSTVSGTFTPTNNMIVIACGQSHFFVNGSLSINIDNTGTFSVGGNEYQVYNMGGDPAILRFYNNRFYIGGERGDQQGGESGGGE